MDRLGQEDRTLIRAAGPDLYRALFRCTSDGLILLDAAGLVLEANAAAGVLIRRPPEALTGRNLVDLIDPSDVARLDAATRQARESGSSQLDFSLIRADNGASRPIAAHLEDVGGVGLLVVLHDITEKSRFLDAVRRERETTRSVLETVNASVFGTDLKGRITVMNRKFRETTGVELSTLIGTDAFNALVASRDRASARAAHETVLERGIVEEIDLSVRCGEVERVMSFNGALVRDADSTPVGVVWVAVDVTTARQLMEDVRRREERTQRNLQQLKEFSRVSSQILQERDLDRVCRMFVEAIRDVSNFNRAILTLCDEEFRGYQWFFAGLSEKEIATFHENKLTSRERVTIFQERFRMGNSYYIPHEEGWHYEGVRSRKPSDDMLDWHPDDFLFIPLFGSNRRIVGIVSVDDPVDGRRPTAESISPLELFANQVAHAIEEKKLAQEVKKTTERYQTLVETMNSGLFTVDLSDRITFVNPALLELTGYKLEDLLGRALADLMPEESVMQFRDRTRVRDTGHARFEAVINTADRSRIPVLISATPYLLNSQKRGAFAIVSDLREQKRAEQERQAMHEKVVEANIKLRDSMTQLQTAQDQLIQAEKLSALGEMVSGVAHELNNPLTGVMGFAELLMKADAPEEVRKTVSRINQEAVRCQKIVQNLLTFAHRPKRPARSIVDVNAVIQKTVDMRSYHLKVDDVDVVLELSDDLPPVLADGYQLQQVFLNIINNAHQAMEETEKRGRLTIRTTDCGANIRIEFIDNGPGIPSDKIGKIFDPFFTTKEIGRGTGLGLSLSYGIIKRHDGTIQAESEPGRGAAFIIALPAQRNATPTVEKAPEPKSRMEAPSGASILIVDDEETIVDLLAAMLESTGHQVETASNGRRALEMARGRDYDLIISDLKMPGMGGQKLYEAIREIKPQLARRMIFSTGDTASPDTQEFFKRTGNAYLSKPFTLEEVETRVSEVLLRAQ